MWTLLAERRPEMKDHGLFFTDIILTFPKPTSAEKEAARLRLGEQFPYFELFREGARDERIYARNKLLLANRGFVWSTVRGGYFQECVDPAVTMGDFVSSGTLGMIHAIEAFDYTRGVRFTTYAFWAIYTYLQRYILQVVAEGIRMPAHLFSPLKKFHKIVERSFVLTGAWPSEETLKEGTGVTDERYRRLQELVHLRYSRRIASNSGEDDDSDDDGEVWGFLLVSGATHSSPASSYADTLTFADVVEHLGRALFSEEERFVLARRYGLEGEIAQKLSKIAREMGLTRQRVHQIERGALTKLRECLIRTVYDQECSGES